MLNKRIIYQDETGGVAIIIPCGLTINEIAATDVPPGSSYKIVDAADVPTDRELRNEWTVSETDLTDGVGE